MSDVDGRVADAEQELSGDGSAGQRELARGERAAEHDALASGEAPAELGPPPGELGPSGELGPPPGELTEAGLEALLFVAERPLTRREIANLAGVPRDVVDERLGDLEVSLRARGLRLLATGDRVELATAPEAGPLLARYLGVDPTRLSAASLETLAIVAYRQPVTKAAVERIRGVDSDYTIRGLVHRRLITELGRADAPGRPILYGTGFDFLERFGLTSLDELPPLDPDVAARLAEEGGGVLPDDESVADGEPFAEAEPGPEAEPAAEAEPDPG